MKYSAIISDGTFQSVTAVLQGPLSKILPKAAEIGYDAVQLTIAKPGDYDIPALKRLLSENGLCVTALATGRIYTVEGLGMGSGDESVRRACVSRLALLTDLCAELGGAGLIIGACRGLVSDAASPELYFAQFERSLAETSAYAGKAAVPVLLELIDHNESDAFCKLAPTQELITRIGAPNLHLYLDTMHLYCENEDIPAMLRKLGGEIPQVDISGEGRICPIDSRIDFSAAMSALKESGFDGTLAFEINPNARADAAEESLNYIKGLMA